MARDGLWRAKMTMTKKVLPKARFRSDKLAEMKQLKARIRELEGELMAEAAEQSQRLRSSVGLILQIYTMRQLGLGIPDGLRRAAKEAFWMDLEG